MKMMLTGFRALLVCFLLYPVAFADTLSNAGFESGLSPWTSIGSADYQGDVTAGPLTLPPFSGIYQGYTMAGMGATTAVPLYADSGGDLATFANLADISALIPPEEAAEIRGSALGQTFTASVGETLSIRYEFATNSGDFVNGDSGGFILLTGPGGSLIDFYMIGDDDLPGFGWRATDYTDGWYTWEFSTAGEYRLTIGAVDEYDTAATSYMLVDNAGAAPIPEPSTLALLCIGLGALAMSCRRRGN